MIALIALCLALGTWFGTALVWFQVDWPVFPIGLRLWRAATWFPFTLLPVWCWRWIGR